ncbi:hypothetical protein [Salinicola salarius]|uniref:hypothetical protein n=1 Tax=Salinicola salarius TaxID=430457 RepID=UPI001300BCD3|nr:hypothetical protein [Salinicola salarius]
MAPTRCEAGDVIMRLCYYRRHSIGFGAPRSVPSYRFVAEGAIASAVESESP